MGTHFSFARAASSADCTACIISATWFCGNCKVDGLALDGMAMLNKAQPSDAFTRALSIRTVPHPDNANKAAVANVFFRTRDIRDILS